MAATLLPLFSPVTAVLDYIAQTTWWLSQLTHTFRFLFSEIGWWLRCDWEIHTFFHLRIVPFTLLLACTQAISLCGWFVLNYHLNCSWEGTDLGWICHLITTHMFYHSSTVADGGASHQTGYTRNNNWQHDSSFSALFFCIPLSFTTSFSLIPQYIYTGENSHW